MRNAFVPARNRTLCKFCNEVVEVGQLFAPLPHAHADCVKVWLLKVDENARRRAAGRRDTMAARFNGRCGLCGGATKVGEQIVKGTWFHAECDAALAPEVDREDVVKLAQKVADRLEAAFSTDGSRDPYRDTILVDGRLVFLHRNGFDHPFVLSESDLDRLLAAEKPWRALVLSHRVFEHRSHPAILLYHSRMGVHEEVVRCPVEHRGAPGSPRLHSGRQGRSTQPQARAHAAPLRRGQDGRRDRLGSARWQGHRRADAPALCDGGAAGRSWRAAPAGRREEAERQAGGAPDCAGLHEPARGPRALDASAAGRAHGGAGRGRLALVRDGAADAKKTA